MSRKLRQTRLLILVLCAGIAELLTLGSALQAGITPEGNASLAGGLAGRSEKLPALENQRVDANARITFQGSAGPAANGATTRPGEQTELVILNQSSRTRKQLFRSDFGRAPPSTFFQ